MTTNCINYQPLDLSRGVVSYVAELPNKTLCDLVIKVAAAVIGIILIIPAFILDLALSGCISIVNCVTTDTRTPVPPNYFADYPELLNLPPDVCRSLIEDGLCYIHDPIKRKKYLEKLIESKGTSDWMIEIIAVYYLMKLDSAKPMPECCRNALTQYKALSHLHQLYITQLISGETNWVRDEIAPFWRTLKGMCIGNALSSDTKEFFIAKAKIIHKERFGTSELYDN